MPGTPSGKDEVQTWTAKLLNVLVSASIRFCFCSLSQNCCNAPPCSYKMEPADTHVSYLTSSVWYRLNTPLVSCLFDLSVMLGRGMSALGVVICVVNFSDTVCSANIIKQLILSLSSYPFGYITLCTAQKR